MNTRSYAAFVSFIRVFVATFLVQMAAVQNIYTKQAVISAISAAVIAATNLTPTTSSS